MVDGERLLAVRHNRVRVWPRPGEALIGWPAGIDLNAVGQGLEPKQDLLSIRVFQLRIRQRILRCLASQRQ